jgi:hypothetical protein
MLKSHRYLLVAALVMGLAAIQAHAQYRPQVMAGGPGVNPNPFIAPGVTLQQAAYNTAVLGKAYQQIPPYLLGYNPYPQISIPTGPALPAPPVALSPYALSTVPSNNPYLSSSSPGSSPYSLSTTPSSYMSPGSYVNPYSYGGGYYPQDPTGAALQGYASVVSAAGQYQVNIQQARMSRETARQMSIDTTRRRIELERWYESTRPTAQQLRDQENARDLERARKDSPETDISSGKALNVLLNSIQKSGQLNLGPNVVIDEDTLKSINVAGASAAGNAGMLKEVNKLTWPEVLQDSGYDDARKRLNKNLALAVSILKDGDPVPDNTVRDIRADYKTMSDKLNDDTSELSASQYIEARRFLNQLNQAVRALTDKNAVKYFNKTWAAKGKNVAELVANMSKEGLSFAAATPGDQAAYRALYLAMREFDAGLTTAQAQK